MASQDGPRDPISQKNHDAQVPLEDKLKDLHRFIEKNAIAVFTSHTSDGQLVSRPMWIKDHSTSADLWFLTNKESHKISELEGDPRVNVAIVKQGEWMSISGTAKLVEDRERIRKYWATQDTIYFPDLKDGVHKGDCEDPRVGLLQVEAQSVLYMVSDQNILSSSFEQVKSLVTGEAPHLGSLREISPEELQRARL
ncbi:hypothetical protein K493DRAFT_241307 [Basidiobolus meristosporus CBS 931.73]|uniref:General stress protein FMN-binding split barrel domain-containing protein n=1 Tax=Basidiobolus meristosporus CBS 931.73 TaxID=1314790 RepID=A0A1Y1X867_9FUNG|nr:hypothetical protein K493DRAFT_241307 [Basidiobolus meristosporus CBS 931.73]|eukprot:ORX81951.1 hypothetical protein K493DRAFT_241307 [Basidiobolus meristosporus CBS 931.73]